MDYESNWKKVEEYDTESLPKSAATEVDKILHMAIADGNSPQMIKALIHQAIYDLEIDNENNAYAFDSLNKMLEQSTNIIEQSVLHSMLGDLYMQYYQSKQWEINRMTNLGDFVPDDIKEWTTNIFFDKIIEHMNTSILAYDELMQVKVADYGVVVKLGNVSKNYFTSLYDFLSRRRIDIFKKLTDNKDLNSMLVGKGIDAKEVFGDSDNFVKLNFSPADGEYALWTLQAYQDFISSLIDRGMAEAQLITELELIDYLRVLPIYHETYALDRLELLLDKWNNDPISIDIVDKLTTLIQGEINISGRGLVINEEYSKKKKIYNLLQEYIAKFSKSSRVGLLQNKMESLTNPEYTITGNSTFVTKGEKRLKMLYRNLSIVKFKLYKVGDATDIMMNRYSDKNLLMSRATFVKDIKLDLPCADKYLFNKFEFVVEVDEAGIYILVNADESKNERVSDSNYIFTVSDLASFSRSSGKNEFEFFVVNRTTGEPVVGAIVDIYKLPSNWHTSTLVKEKSIVTSSMGLARYNKDIPNNDVYYIVRSVDGATTTLNSLPWDFHFHYTNNYNQSSDNISILTDRGIYRPGQTVYFKAIATRASNNNSSLLTGKALSFELLDANRRELSKMSITTNEFGSISGEFVLPTDVMNGSFIIQSDLGSTYFRVEEYKRPTFDIEFDKIAQTYTFDEELQVTGKAESFSGIKLQGAEVTYRITRSYMMWRTWGGRGEHFDEGVTTTNADGSFVIAFTPKKEDVIDNLLSSIYRFSIEATVTDINGETQSSQYDIVVGDVSMILSLDVGDKIEKNTIDKVPISATNLDGENVSAKGDYKIYLLNEDDSIDTQVTKGVFEVGEQKQLKEEIKNLPSGKYKISLESKDDKDRNVSHEKIIVVFSYDDKLPPIKTNEWFVVKNNTFSKSKSGEVIFGATDRVNILYELWQENTLLERKWFTVDNENQHFTIPYSSDYNNGVTLMLNYVKDEKFYSHSVNILKEEEKNDLYITLDVFRDKLRPNSQEEWRISIRDSQGNPTVGEVLASMYDLSLDKIYETPTWRFSPNVIPGYWSRALLYTDSSDALKQANWRKVYDLKYIESQGYDSFNWYNFSFYSNTFGMRLRGGSREMVMMHDSPAPAPMFKSQLENNASSLVEEEVSANDSMENSVVEETSNIRRNFDETAFFFPQLVTNNKGEAQIAFTVPDTNTKWKFRVLAHDKNLNVGQTEAITISQKDLMITPNMPRFIRHGDKTSISTKVSNLSDKTIEGEVNIQFFNPITDEVIDVNINNNSQTFIIEEGASTQATWMFDVPSGVDMIGVRIVATSDNFSDGEQHALVVLPNRMLVTESIRMDLNGNQDKSFVFDRLVRERSTSQDNYRLTLEFTTNPAWYAVQALPVLSTPDNDNSVSWFAAYYATKIGAHISKAYPRVMAMIEAWKKQGGTSETLFSNLDKNEELKGLLLQETPWMLEANSETEQMQKLSLLFDINRSNNISTKAIEKLQQLQTYQGGWSWFEGLRANVGITHYVLYGFNQLKQLNINEESVLSSMQAKAIEYIDGEALMRFESLKKLDANWRKTTTISGTNLEYLFVRSLYPNIEKSKEVVDMIDFYTSVVMSNWTKLDMYQRSLLVTIAKSNGNDKLIQDIIKSYREHATTNDEMGMYWANNRAHVFMSQSAISVHTFIMDAFAKSGAISDEMDNMKRWLLKQKQTQQWESTHATLDAIYALLSTGGDWFTSDGNTSISLGGIDVDTSSAEIGTGYIKESWTKSEIAPDMGNVSVSQRGNTPAWGALYLQYFEDIDKISAADGSLSVNKQLFVEKIDTNGKKLMKVDDNLRVGDKVVVRITVRTDRDMEFVHIKDMRASSLEPIDQVSGVKWDSGVVHYQSPKDASTNYFFDVLPRGTYVFEYNVIANRTGEYSNGITTIQSMYAPEFTTHSASERINVK